MKKNGQAWEKLPEKVNFFILDVHHSIAILELIRILVDLYSLTFHQAFLLASQTFTMHAHGTLEELSMCWRTDIMQRVLPRHMELVSILDHFFVEKIRSSEKLKHDVHLQSRL
mmetsp:Transcript_22724/g.35002  ORF Transcript_22724/g.35002 Transcript_22724/m.35002 type:complete len:113 (-) Transcript_22724:284-622(-)